MATRQVKIGERDITIPPFRGMKALRAGAILARITQQVPTITDDLSEYRQNYREKNTAKLTPAIAIARGYDIPSEAFGEQGFIEMAAEPSTEESLIAIFPKVFDVAQSEMVKLLALVAIPNSDLRKADEDGSIDEALDRFGRDLLYEGELHELVELVLVAYEMIGEQFQGKQDRLGKLRAALLRQEPLTTETPKSSSSTDSQPSTDGPAAKSSSRSRGKTSRATSAA